MLNTEARSLFGLEGREVVFGFQIPTRGFNADNIVHYNMLHLALDFGTEFQRANERWDFLAESILRNILSTEVIERCIVLVAPMSELIDRASSRRDVEHGVPAGYDSGFWVSALQQLDLYRIYENFFDLLDTRSLPYQVIYSSRELPSGFAESDRVYVHANLKGKFIPAPPASRINEIAEDPRCHYQSVRLPRGVTTSAGAYHHVGGGRDLTFKKVLRGNLIGASILDVGSALGDLLFTAERFGASELVGIEPHPGRFEMSGTLADLLSSQAEFYSVDFLNYDARRTFDHVFLLNVIHHVRDFGRFIEKAAVAARQTLTIEFPSLADEKFRSAWNLSSCDGEALNRFPVIGVSSLARADQTFVYSAMALSQIVEEIGGFAEPEVDNSPIDNRLILRFERNNSSLAAESPPQVTVVRSRLTNVSSRLRRQWRPAYDRWRNSLPRTLRRSDSPS